MSEPDEGSGRECDRVDAERSTRRTFLTVLSFLGLDLAADAIPAWAEPASERPKEGDVLVAIDAEKPVALETKDIPRRGTAGSCVADGSRKQYRSPGLAPQQGPAGPSRPVDAGRIDQGARGRGCRCLFRDLSACGLRGEWLAGGSADSRMLLSLFALQSARSGSGHGRPCDPFLGGAAAQDCRGQADRRQALHRSRRYRSNLIAAARLVGNIDRRSHRQSGTEANPTRCVVLGEKRKSRRKRHDNSQASHAKRGCRRRAGSGRHLADFRATDDRAGLGNAYAGPDAGHPAEICAGHRRAAEEAGRRRLADVPPHLRRLGLQPARPDHAGTTSSRLQPVWAFATGQIERPRGAADREQRRDVRRDAGQPGDRARRQDRRSCCGATSARSPRT